MANCDLCKAFGISCHQPDVFGIVISSESKMTIRDVKNNSEEKYRAIPIAECPAVTGKFSVAKRVAEIRKIIKAYKNRGIGLDNWPGPGNY